MPRTAMLAIIFMPLSRPQDDYGELENECLVHLIIPDFNRQDHCHAVVGEVFRFCTPVTSKSSNTTG